MLGIIANGNIEDYLPIDNVIEMDGGDSSRPSLSSVSLIIIVFLSYIKYVFDSIISLLY